jgi:hypothetical protein
MFSFSIAAISFLLIWSMHGLLEILFVESGANRSGAMSDSSVLRLIGPDEARDVGLQDGSYRAVRLGPLLLQLLDDAPDCARKFACSRSAPAQFHVLSRNCSFGIISYF